MKKTLTIDTIQQDIQNETTRVWFDFYGKKFAISENESFSLIAESGEELCIKTNHHNLKLFECLLPIFKEIGKEFNGQDTRINREIELEKQFDIDDYLLSTGFFDDIHEEIEIELNKRLEEDRKKIISKYSSSDAIELYDNFTDTYSNYDIVTDILDDFEIPYDFVDFEKLEIIRIKSFSSLKELYAEHFKKVLK